jgi:pteridine reductase
MTDIHASQALKDHSAYCAAKAGLDMLTRSLAREFAPEVRVNGLALGAVLWPSQGDEKRQKEVMANTALKRTAELHEVCAAIRFLIDDADYSTGQILSLDGGRTRYT